MGFDLGDLGRVVAAVATGGLSEVAVQGTQALAGATAAVAGAAGNVVGSALGGMQSGAGAGGCAGANMAPGSQFGGMSISTCCRYQFHNDLLLDTQTGSVWKYDSQENALHPVERKADQFRKGLEAAGLLRAKAALDDTFKGLAPAEQNAYRGVFDALHQATADRTRRLLDEMKSSSKPKTAIKARAQSTRGG